MPSWWRGKSMFRSHSCNSGWNRDAESSFLSSDRGSKLSKIEKAKSFDGVTICRNYRYSCDPQTVASDSDSGRRCHPLPPPIDLASVLPMHRASADATGPSTGRGTACSGSYSASPSSLGSTDTSETIDLAVQRQPEATKALRSRSSMQDPGKQHNTAEHERFDGISISPLKELQLHDHDISSNGNGQPRSKEVVEEASRSLQRSAGSKSRGYRHGVAVFRKAESPTGKQDDLKGPHPLPRPPSSSASHSQIIQSNWKKGKLIGRGTFGHVFLGFNNESGQICAIKEVKVISDDSNSKECLKQLSQEISLLSQLSHPNIVKYLGSELNEDSLSVYLEYVSGGSIHKLLQDYGSFKEPLIRNYTAQILSGLAYLHGKNKVHRDVKGANILVGPNGEIKLADFGMAKHISSQNSMCSFKGSPYWMAPEVIGNSRGYSLSVDIWSLGCTVLEMATSKPPWHQYEGVAAIFKIANSKDIPEFPSHLSADGKDFLNCCFQRDPSARPAASQLLDHPFVRDQTATKIARFNPAKELLRFGRQTSA